MNLSNLNTSCSNCCLGVRRQQQIRRFERSPPSTLTSLRPLQQIPPHPVNSGMVFEWLGAYDCSFNKLCIESLIHLSVCQTPLVCELISKTQTSVPLTKPSPFQRETRRGTRRSCLFTTQRNTKASPFPSLRVHSKHEGANMRCRPSCAPGGT